MREETIAELYKEKPIAKDKIAKAAGFAVFSNLNVNLFVVSAGSGYGVAHNSKSGADTFMKMGTVGVGLGAGVKDFRAVIIFKDAATLKTFTNDGWEWGGHADAAAVAGDKGGEAGVAGEVTGGMEIYTFTESGVALQAMIAGTKYWQDDDLN